MRLTRQFRLTIDPVAAVIAAFISTVWVGGEHTASLDPSVLCVSARSLHGDEGFADAELIVLGTIVVLDIPVLMETSVGTWADDAFRLIKKRWTIKRQKELKTHNDSK